MKHRFLSRILLTYSAIVFCILAAVFTSYALISRRETDRRIEEADTASFMGYVANCEETLGIMNEAAVAVRSLNSVDLFAYSRGDDYYRRLTDLFRDLSTVNLQLATRDIQVVVHKMNDATAISSASSISVSRLAEDIGIGMDTYRRTVTGLSASALLGGRYLFTDRHVLYFTAKDYISSRIVVLIIADASRFIMKMPSPGMSASFAVGGDAASDLRSSPALLPESGEGAVDDGGVRRMSRGTKTYSWVGSKFLELTYFYATDDGAGNRRFLFVIANMFLAFAGACAIAFLVIALFSIRLFRPVERIIDSLVSMDEGDPGYSGIGDDLEFIAREVAAIRRSNQDLVRKVEDGNRLYRNAVIQDLMAGGYDPESMRDDLRRISLEWLLEECAAVSFEIVFKPGASESDRTAISDEVARLIMEQLSADFSAVPLPSRTGAPLFAIRFGGDRDARDRLTSIVSLIDSAFDLRLTAFLGPAGSGPKALRSSLNTVYRLMDQRNSIPLKSVFGPEDLRRSTAGLRIYPLPAELQLIAAIEKGDTAETAVLLEDYFSGLADDDFADREDRDSLAAALANTYRRGSARVGMDTPADGTEAKAFYGLLRACSSADEMRDAAVAGFRKLIGAASEIRVEKEGRMKAEMETYIRDNLGRNISLLDMADHFKLTPNYTSFLFKTALKENFKDYLARSRFEVALAILKERPSIKLADLAEKVGITNVNTLIRLFNRFTGKSPGQFIRRSKSP